ERGGEGNPAPVRRKDLDSSERIQPPPPPSMTLRPDRGSKLAIWARRLFRWRVRACRAGCGAWFAGGAPCCGGRGRDGDSGCGGVLVKAGQGPDAGAGRLAEAGDVQGGDGGGCGNAEAGGVDGQEAGEERPGHGKAGAAGGGDQDGPVGQLAVGAGGAAGAGALPAALGGEAVL